MPDLPQLLVFMAAGWLLNLTPGPDVLYIVSQSLRSGVSAGVAAALGIVSGCFVHVLAAALGVGALLATSSTAFTVLKGVGAAYLVWVGVRLLRARGGVVVVPVDASGGGHGAPVPASVAAAELRRIYWRGFLTNVLNPKVALFFLAFVPQFIAPQTADKLTAFLLLGLLFNLNSLPINLGYAWLAGWASRRVGAVQRALHWLDRVAGVLFIGFGLRLALSEHPSR